VSAHGERPLEMWGGVECTVNRVGDRYRDQLAASGHDVRIEDLTLLAGLGIRTLRYPVLWERVCPDSPDDYDWRWTDERMARLRALGVRPIVGLLHHGSGPRWTSLVDPAFPAHFAELAARVAERYPWVDAFTPINEPLTTARFSGLYGHWYPHTRDPAVFARCLLHECDAIALAMKRIREVSPRAILVQTEDIGSVHGTARLAHQVEFENERRWLSFDLLMGRIDRTHRMWRELRSWGASEAELERFVAAPCPPDVLGVNHYITSDRFLDEDLSMYPATTHGGNGRERYADVEAVRARFEHTGEIDATLRDTWSRYGLPLAITEAQLAGPREAQLRWLLSAWHAAERARAEGADVRAVTAWSLLGAYDWNSLVTVESGYYESGAFDLRAPSPRPTALARLVTALATGEAIDEPAAAGRGWWHRPDRLFPAVRAKLAPGPPVAAAETARPILVLGANGTLGRAFARVCAERDLPSRAVARAELDVTDADAVERIVAELEPWAIINAAGYVEVDAAQRDPERCFAANAAGPQHLARICARQGVRLLTFSTDLVFDGRKREPYVEADTVGPINVYGESKAVSERHTLDAYPGALVVRTAAFFGPWDHASFLARGLAALERGLPWPTASDLVISPTFVLDLVHTSLDLLIDREHGLWHLANEGAVTWTELAQRAAEMANLDPSRIEARPFASFGWPAPRPLYSVLGSMRGRLMPALDDALGRFIVARAPGRG
jgi:dTDP-4-dehydrorhamnose reductase